MLLLIIGLAALRSHAQETVNVYICVDGAGCSHARTSGRLTVTEAELVLGQERPSSNHSVVCSQASCEWTSESIADLDFLYDGDGVPLTQPETIELELAPAEPIELEFEPVQPIDLFADLSDPDNTAYPTLFCDAARCKRVPTILTREEVEFLLKEPPPSDNYYLRCEQRGVCRWEARDEDNDPVLTACQEPLSGLWSSPPGMVSGTCPAFISRFMPNLNRFTSDRVSFPTPFNMRRWILQNDPSFDSAGVSFDQPSVCEYRMTVREEGTSFSYTLNMLTSDRLTSRMEMNFRSSELNCDLIFDFEASRAGE